MPLPLLSPTHPPSHPLTGYTYRPVGDMSGDGGGTPPTEGPGYDAVIVLGGGLDTDGAPHHFVKARLDAGARHPAGLYICLGRGTTHKPPPRDSKGFPIDESTASAHYLMEQHGIPPSKIVKDTWYGHSAPL